jgi:hypothetical protein
MKCVDVRVQWLIRGRAIVSTGGVITYAVYVLCNIVTRSLYQYCSGNVKMPSVCVIEIHATVNCIKILGVVQQCFYADLIYLRLNVQCPIY